MKSSIAVSVTIAGLSILVSACEKNDPPVVFDQTFSISENSRTGIVVGQVLAGDVDDEEIFYSITDGNTGDAFEISETDGTITVLTSEALDYETIHAFFLTVKVSDKRNDSYADITVNLTNMAPPSENLILYLPFNGNLKDSSSSGNNGIHNSSENYTEGKWDQGLDFNGYSDVVELSNTIYSLNGFSLSVWIKTRGAYPEENNGVIISKYNMTYHTRCFMIYSFGAYENRSDNRFSAAFYPYGNSSQYHDYARSYMEAAELTVFPDPSLWTILNPARLVTEKWTHCVINMKPAELEIWLDGVLCTKKQREYATYNNVPEEPTYIGNMPVGGAGSNNHFNGVMDELRIYNRPLTEAEIALLNTEI